MAKPGEKMIELPRDFGKFGKCSKARQMKAQKQLRDLAPIDLSAADWDKIDSALYWAGHHEHGNTSSWNQVREKIGTCGSIAATRGVAPAKEGRRKSEA